MLALLAQVAPPAQPQGDFMDKLIYLVMLLLPLAWAYLKQRETSRHKEANRLLVKKAEPLLDRQTKTEIAVNAALLGCYDEIDSACAQEGLKERPATTKVLEDETIRLIKKWRSQLPKGGTIEELIGKAKDLEARERST